MELASNARNQRGVLESLMAGLMMLLMNLWCYPLMVLWTGIGMILFPFVFGFGCYVLKMPSDRTMRWIIWVVWARLAGADVTVCAFSTREYGTADTW